MNGLIKMFILMPKLWSNLRVLGEKFWVKVSDVLTKRDEFQKTF